MNIPLKYCYNFFLICLLSSANIVIAHEANDKTCDSYDRNVDREITLLSSQATPQPSILSLDIAYDLMLTPQHEIKLLAEPHRLSLDDASFAVILPLEFPISGQIRISVSEEAWIDVVKKANDTKANQVIASTDFTGRFECPTLRKLVEYDLSDNAHYFLQLTGVPTRKIKLVITHINPE